MAWAWDRDKAAANLRKHKVSFELACRVFDDPDQMSRPDPDPDEERWQTLGRPFGSSLTVLMVVHTDADETGADGRIISARRATPHERRAYEGKTF
ncbi:MAG: BrnT family toxin [Caulobacteraceae bacterium]|nr:BrnT family toxin [Caulobacteraceae bacterium]